MLPTAVLAPNDGTSLPTVCASAAVGSMASVAAADERRRRNAGKRRFKVVGPVTIWVHISECAS